MESLENNQSIKSVVQSSNSADLEKQTFTTGMVKTGHRRVLLGRVISNKPDKTIVVRVERYVQHPLYKKYYKRSKKMMTHDEHNECRIGDLVRVMECRPLSRRKRWILTEVVERAK